jgi:ankyrin repeat protein
MDDRHQFLIRATGLYDRTAPLRGWLEAEALLKAHPEWPGDDLAVAATLGDAQSVASIVANDPDAASQPIGPRGWPPLLYLCYSRVRDPRSDWLAAARALIDAGADAAAFWKWGGQYTFAATTGVFGQGELGPNNQPEHPAGLPLARLLLEAGADPNDAQGLYNRMFQPGDAHLALLLEFGLGPEHRLNWTDMDGGPTPGTTLQYQLMNAAEHGHADRIARILAAGVDPGQPDPNGHQAWKLAMVSGFPDVAAQLAAAGAAEVPLSPNERLAGACRAADAGQVRALLQAHPDLAIDPSWLQGAAGDGRIEAVRFLLDQGVPADSAALQSALWSGHCAVAQLLYERGADPTERDSRFDGDALGHATHGGFSEAIALVTSWGVSTPDTQTNGDL